MTLSPRFPPARAHSGYPTGTPTSPQSPGSPPDSLWGTPDLLPNQPASPPAPKGCPIPALSGFLLSSTSQRPPPCGQPSPPLHPDTRGHPPRRPQNERHLSLPDRVAPHLEEVSPCRALWLLSALASWLPGFHPAPLPPPKQTHLVRLILHSAQRQGLSAQRAHDAVQGLRAAQPLPAHQLAKVRLGGTEWAEVRGSPPFHPLSSLSNSIFVPPTLLLAQCWGHSSAGDSPALPPWGLTVQKGRLTDPLPGG